MTKKKFKQTKQLVRIALNDGLTQNEIAKLCRTQQSKVSEWKSGKTDATEAQIQPLIERYGDVLFRKPFRLYSKYKDNDVQYVKVEGKILFQEAVRKVAAGRLSDKPVGRFTLHERARGRFVLVFEERTPSADTRYLTESDRFSLWNCTHFELDSMEALLSWGDGLPQAIQSDQSLLKDVMPASLAIPRLLREALLKNGYNVPDVEVIPCEL